MNFDLQLRIKLRSFHRQSGRQNSCDDSSSYNNKHNYCSRHQATLDYLLHEKTITTGTEDNKIYAKTSEGVALTLLPTST
jgi:hypothetical protein